MTARHSRKFQYLRIQLDISKNLFQVQLNASKSNNIEIEISIGIRSLRFFRIELETSDSNSIEFMHMKFKSKQCSPVRAK